MMSNNFENLSRKNPLCHVEEDPLIEKLFNEAMVKEAEKRKQLKATPLGKRIQRFTKTTFNYKKEPHSFRHKSTGEIVNETGKETGKVIDISKIENLAVVDIDINKTVDDERKEKIRQSILLRLPEDVGLVQTASGGLHIYCDRDDYPLKTDSQTKAYKCSDYDIDVFACVHGNTRYVTQANTEVVKFESEEDKKAATTYENIKAKQLHEELTDIDPRCTVKDSCYISLAGSKEYPNVKNNRKVLHYIDLNNYLSKTNLASLETVLDIFGIDLKYHVSSYDTNIHLTADGISSMPKEFAELLVCGLTDVTIHNYCHHSIDKELSLFPLFNAINSLINIESVDEEDINAYYDEVKSNNTLTANAEMNWDKTRENCSNKKSTPYVLQKIVKIWCPEYYKNTVVPEIRKMKLLKSKSSINEDENIDYEKYIKQIDLYDSFSLTDIRNKSESCQYKNIIEVLSDLSRVIRFIETGSMYIQKEYNIFDKCWCIAFVTDSNMMKSLKMIKLWKTESKTITAYDVLLTGLSKLTLQGVMFNAGDVPNVYSLFQGYKYRVLEQVDMTIISMFLDFIREEIADSNDELFEYVLNWIANIVQHPGIKNETALVLKGLQGIGKNRFTDVLSELFAGYSSRNVTEIGELTGNFNSVVESKMLIILNELKNCGDDRLANFNTLKSVITDIIIRINEKNQPRRNSENVANFVFVTNNPFPVKIEAGDRRYVVLACNGKYKNNFSYFEQLCESFSTEFYDNLLTYFMKRDLSKFNVRLIPMTQAKLDIIEAI